MIEARLHGGIMYVEHIVSRTTMAEGAPFLRRRKNEFKNGATGKHQYSSYWPLPLETLEYLVGSLFTDSNNFMELESTDSIRIQELRRKTEVGARNHLLGFTVS